MKPEELYHETWEIHDSSKIQCFMDCPRKYFFKYMLGWENTLPKHDLIFGSAVHEGMEHLMLNPGDVDGAHEAFLNHYREYYPEETDSIYRPKTPDNVLLAFAQYVSRYQDQDDFKTLYTEVGGKISTGKHDVVYKIDAVCIDSGDRVFALEHKTTKNGVRQVWLDEFLLSLQIGTYSYALSCLIPTITPTKPHNSVVIVNGISFSKTKVDLVRQPVKKTNNQITCWLITVDYWVSQIKDETHIMLEESSPDDKFFNAFPMNPRACTNYFRLCQYHDFCMAWANPLKQAFDDPPDGLEYHFWNPLKDLNIKTEINLENKNA